MFKMAFELSLFRTHEPCKTKYNNLTHLKRFLNIILFLITNNVSQKKFPTPYDKVGLKWIMLMFFVYLSSV